jgi:hypothetical protein
MNAFSTGNPVFDALVTVLANCSGDFHTDHIEAIHSHLLDAYEKEPVRTESLKALKQAQQAGGGNPESGPQER